MKRNFFRFFTLILVLGLIIFAGCLKSNTDLQTAPKNENKLMKTFTTTQENYALQRYEIKCEIGPNKVYRIKGKPEEISGILDLSKGDFYRIMINNGDGEKKEVTAGEIYIDNKKIVSDNDFKRKNFTFLKSGQIQNDNPDYLIRLKGKPGSFITINFYAYGKKEINYNQYFEKMSDLTGLIVKLLKEKYDSEKTYYDYLKILFLNMNKISFETFISDLQNEDLSSEIQTLLSQLKSEYFIPEFYIKQHINNDNLNENFIIIFEKDEYHNIYYGCNQKGEIVSFMNFNNGINYYFIYPKINEMKETNFIVNKINDDLKNNYIINPFLTIKALECFTDNSGFTVCVFGGNKSQEHYYIKIVPCAFKSCTCSEFIWSQPAEFYAISGYSGKRIDLGSAAINCNIWWGVPDNLDDDSNCVSNIYWKLDSNYAPSPNTKIINHWNTSMYEDDDFLTGGDDFIDEFDITTTDDGSSFILEDQESGGNCGEIRYTEQHYKGY